MVETCASLLIPSHRLVTDKSKCLRTSPAVKGSRCRGKGRSPEKPPPVLFLHSAGEMKLSNMATTDHALTQAFLQVCLRGVLVFPRDRSGLRSHALAQSNEKD
jgi:hypothetical protein